MYKSKMTHGTLQELINHTAETDNLDLTAISQKTGLSPYECKKHIFGLKQIIFETNANLPISNADFKEKCKDLGKNYFATMGLVKSKIEEYVKENIVLLG